MTRSLGEVSEEIAQSLAGFVYLLAFALFVVPITFVNVVWHAGLDMWVICEGSLRTSKRI